MDELLRALGHPVRLRAIQILLQHGPMRQEELRHRLEALEGTLSRHMKELLSVGLVARSSPRGECRIRVPNETLQALQAVAALDEAIAELRAAEAQQAADAWRRLPHDR